MEAIRSWWEVPCVAHYCHIFQKPFKLPTFEIEELEDALLLDSKATPSKLMSELFRLFLNGIIDSEITPENWPLMLKLHLKWRCDNLGERWNPLEGDQQYQDLDPYSRIAILHKLCHWRLELDDIADLLRGIDGPYLRLEPLGRDMEGSKYWYFFGTRLYKEAGPPKKKLKGTGSGRRNEGSGTNTPKGGVSTPKGAGSTKRGRPPNSAGRGRGKKTDSPAPTNGRKGRGRPPGKATPTNTPQGRRGRRSKVPLENGTEEAEPKDEKVEGEEVGVAREEEEEEEESVVGEVSTVNGSSSQHEEVKEEDLAIQEPTTQMLENVKKVLTTTTEGCGWCIVGSTAEDWSDVIEELSGTKHQETRRLVNTLKEYLPEIEHILSTREKQLKKRLLADMPRRTSDRIAIKSAVKEEEERQCALERELQREELRRLQEEEELAREEEVDRKRQRRLEEALQRKKHKEEQQQKLRQEEESNWEKAMSGELSGRRKAAIGAAENVSEVQKIADSLLLSEDRDLDLYTAMYKILSALRRHDEGWVFEEPVTEAIAPGYFEVVSEPMDYITVEKKLEEHTYSSREEFEKDMDLIYSNCCDYNGEDSEYSELAEDVRKLFRALVKEHIDGVTPEDDNLDNKKRRKRESRSPSECRTPEFSSESSSEEESEDEDASDESYTEGRPRKPNQQKGRVLRLQPPLERTLKGMAGPRMGGPPPPQFPPNLPPHLYHHYMQQQQQYMAMHGRMPRPFPPHMSPDMYPPGYPHMRMPPPYPGGAHPGLPRGPFEGQLRGPPGMLPPGVGPRGLPPRGFPGKFPGIQPDRQVEKLPEDHPDGPMSSGKPPAPSPGDQQSSSGEHPSGHPNSRPSSAPGQESSRSPGPSQSGMSPHEHHPMYPPASAPPPHPSMMAASRTHGGYPGSHSGPHPYPHPPPHPSDPLYRHHMYNMHYHRAMMDPRGMGPRGVGMDPRAMGMDPRTMGMDPRAMGMDPRAMGMDPRAMGMDPRAMGMDPRAMGMDPRAMGMDPRAMGMDPRAFRMDKNTTRSPKTPSTSTESKKDDQLDDERNQTEKEEAREKAVESKDEPNKSVQPKLQGDDQAKEKEEEVMETTEESDDDKNNEKEKEKKEKKDQGVEEREKNVQPAGKKEEKDVQEQTKADSATVEDKNRKEKKKNWTPEELEKYRHQQHILHSHRHRLDSRHHGGPHFPPPFRPGAPPMSSESGGGAGTNEDAMAAHYSQQQHPMYGSPYPPPNLHGDPRAMEAAHHHYWMEMQRHQHYRMMRHQQMMAAQHKKKHLKQDHQNIDQNKKRDLKDQVESGKPNAVEVGPKERSAETGQEGLEEFSDYQESLGQNSSSWKSDKGTSNSDQCPNQLDCKGKEDDKSQVSVLDKEDQTEEDKTTVSQEERPTIADSTSKPNSKSGHDSKDRSSNGKATHNDETETKVDPGEGRKDRASPAGLPHDKETKKLPEGDEEDDEGRLKGTSAKKSQQHLYMEHHRPHGPPHHFPPGAMMGSPANGYPPMPYSMPHYHAPPPGHFPPSHYPPQPPYPPPAGDDMRSGPYSPHLSYYPPPSHYRYPPYPPPPGEGWGDHMVKTKRPASRDSSDNDAPAAKRHRDTPPSLASNSREESVQ